MLLTTSMSFKGIEKFFSRNFSPKSLVSASTISESFSESGNNMSDVGFTVGQPRDRCPADAWLSSGRNRRMWQLNGWNRLKSGLLDESACFIFASSVSIELGAYEA